MAVYTIDNDLHRVDLSVALLRDLLVETPFSMLDVDSNVDILRYEPRKRFLDEDRRDSKENRTTDYDLPRIRHFYDKYKAGKKVSPPIVAIDCRGGLWVMDGCHRVCAAILAGAESIRVVLETLGNDPEQEIQRLAALIEKLKQEKNHAHARPENSPAPGL